MRTRSYRRRAALLTLACSLLWLQGCATNHLFRWSHGETSVFTEPYEEYAPYVRPAGLVLGLPVTVVWDVATFPFQWLWDVYPYGSDLGPGNRESASVIY